LVDDAKKVSLKLKEILNSIQHLLIGLVFGLL
jgi:hypothetical protein